MKRIFKTVYYRPNEDGVKRERTINLGLIKYYSVLYDHGEKDRSLKIGSISIEYIPGLLEVLKQGEILIKIGKG